MNKIVHKCGRCRNHGILKLLKGHKPYCPFRHCPCSHCLLVTQKRNIYKDEQVMRRKKIKHNSVVAPGIPVVPSSSAAHAATAPLMDADVTPTELYDGATVVSSLYPLSNYSQAVQQLREFYPNGRWYLPPVAEPEGDVICDQMVLPPSANPSSSAAHANTDPSGKEADAILTELYAVLPGPSETPYSSTFLYSETAPDLKDRDTPTPSVYSEMRPDLEDSDTPTPSVYSETAPDLEASDTPTPSVYSETRPDLEDSTLPPRWYLPPAIELIQRETTDPIDEFLPPSFEPGAKATIDHAGEFSQSDFDLIEKTAIDDLSELSQITFNLDPNSTSDFMDEFLPSDFELVVKVIIDDLDESSQPTSEPVAKTTSEHLPPDIEMGPAFNKES